MISSVFHLILPFSVRWVAQTSSLRRGRRETAPVKISTELCRSIPGPLQPVILPIAVQSAVSARNSRNLAATFIHISLYILVTSSIKSPRPGRSPLPSSSLLNSPFVRASVPALPRRETPARFSRTTASALFPASLRKERKLPFYIIIVTFG